MGADYKAKTIIGVRVKNTEVTERKRGCSHAEANGKFCPECGKPMWVAEKNLHPVVQRLYDEDEKGPIKLTWGTDQGTAYVGRYVLSGTYSNAGKEDEKADLPDDLNVPALKEELRQLLGDLYDPKEFGLWSVLYCSY